MCAAERSRSVGVSHEGAEPIMLASVQSWEWPRPLLVGVFTFTGAHMLVCESNMEDSKIRTRCGVINATVLTGVVVVVVVDSSNTFLSRNSSS